METRRKLSWESKLEAVKMVEDRGVAAIQFEKRMPKS